MFIGDFCTPVISSRVVDVSKNKPGNWSMVVIDIVIKLLLEVGC